jgi:prepilin-type processing-associated H-X9-DG protein
MENGVFSLPRPPYAGWANLPSSRHRRQGTLSFADGHVSKIRWRYEKRFKSYGQPVANDDDLRDLRTLQGYCPDPLF